MFKIIPILFIISIIFGCGNNEPTEGEGEASIDISPQELSVSNEATSQTITIVANVSWAVSSSADWCTVSPANGYAGTTILTITTTGNEDFQGRNATLTFNSVTYKKAYPVSQSFLVKEVNVTDKAFRTYCIDHLDTDGDGIFSLKEAADVTNINISGLNIETLAGIESFTALEALNCSNNKLEEIDLSVLKTLTSLNCSANELSELDIKQNINLTTLNCTGNSSLINIYVWTDFIPNQNYSKPDGSVYVQPEIPTPPGYTLVWQDEFNDQKTAGKKAALPNTGLWWYETGGGGWGNNEIQDYIAGVKGQDTCAMIYDGTLKIIAKKAGSEVLSIRMNTSASWTYGYFEARLKLPEGKGTWPAFWLLPKNFATWPDDGEIDIMEEVGYRPNWVASSIHCKAYYHSIGTQKTAETYLSTAESDFHIYALEWTKDDIKGLVDGEVYFTFQNDHTNNKDTWPFDQPFYLKLNLAWGGSWGGAQGVDESALPTTYEIDYARVFQKN